MNTLHCSNELEEQHLHRNQKLSIKIKIKKKSTITIIEAAAELAAEQGLLRSTRLKS